MNLPNGGDKQVINDANKAPQHHNHYDLSYPFASSERFGEVNPFVFCYGVPDDKNLTFRIKQSLRTMSLKSPLLQNLKKSLDFYAVPTRAILPHNYDKLLSNPVIGEDVTADYVNSLISLKDGEFTGLFDIVGAALDYGGVVNNESWLVDEHDQKYFVAEDWDKFIHLLAVLETIFADDSLFAAFRMPIGDRCGVEVKKKVDEALKQAWLFYHTFLYNLNSTPVTFTFLDSNKNVYLTKTYNLKNLSERMRLYFDFLECPLVDWNFVLADPAYNSAYASFTSAYDVDDVDLLDRDSPHSLYPYLMDTIDVSKSIDIRPILAYQLVCAEYFTNDKIDFVYSADMFRDLYEGWFIHSSNVDSFVLNGNFYPYDGFSAYSLGYLFGDIVSDFAKEFTHHNWYTYSLFLNLFTRKRSLRFVDYFTGARSHPLAVGDVNIGVSSNEVSAIDVSKGLQTARYLLAVNRVGPKAKEYLKGIFGSNQRTRNDVPVKIGHISEVIYGVETQNTGVAQMEQDQSITTNLVSNSKDFAFQMDLSESTILIGVSTYELERFYLQGWSKFANKVDRFDHFNPYFQYTGDQPILQTEMSAGLGDANIFGYQTKDMEYKLQTGYAIGAFRKELRGWIFAQQDIDDEVTISPDFIRANQTELDRYYLQMTALMASQRYHFICFYDNKIEASRNMVFDPQILK